MGQMSSLLPLLSLLACQAPAPSPTSSGVSGGSTGSDDETPVEDTATPADDLPTEWVYVPDEVDLEPMDLDEVEAAIEEVVEVYLLLDPLELTASFQAFRDTHADADCPIIEDRDLSTYWQGDCTTADGAEFIGYAYSRADTDLTVGDQVYDDIGELAGIGKIAAPDGTNFEFWGGSTHRTFRSEDSADLRGAAYLFGQMIWTGPSAGDTWMDDGFIVDLVSGTATDLDLGTNEVHIDGSIGGLTGATTTVLLDDVSMYGPERSRCHLEPAGQISVRDPSGLWVVVDFHGPIDADDAVYEPDCDGCGRAWWGAEDLGLVCPDLSPLWDWERRPWD